MINEPVITINGYPLSNAQSMALRVACTDYFYRMEEKDALGVDGHGRAMAKAYRERLSEVLGLILRGEDQAYDPPHT